MRGAPEGRDSIRCLCLYRTGVAQGCSDEDVSAMARVLRQLNLKK